MMEYSALSCDEMRGWDAMRCDAMRCDAVKLTKNEKTSNRNCTK